MHRLNIRMMYIQSRGKAMSRVGGHAVSEVTTRVGRPYPQRMSPTERREQLLDAALTIIVRDGIHKVSIDTVAREADITRPAVYARFKDTNELLRASLDRETRGVAEQ